MTTDESERNLDSGAKGVPNPRLGGVLRLGSTRISELDALRGLAALIVLVHHVFVIFNDDVRTVLNGAAFTLIDLVQEQNTAAVLTFFVLSGYAIGLATRKREPTTRCDIAHYARMRCRRILPLYWFSLVFTAALGLVYGRGNEPSFSLDTLIGNALFLQTSASAKGNWFVPYGLNGPYWSISYEAFFYALLPVALLFVRLSPVAAYPKIALVGLGVVTSFVGLTMQSVAPSPFSSFLTLWVVWLVGYVTVDLRAGLGSVLLVTAPALIAGAAVVLLTLLGLQSDTLSSMLQGTVIASAFSVAALYPSWTQLKLVRFFRHAFVLLFRRIGDGSYALYLLHYPLLLAIHDSQYFFDCTMSFTGILWALVVFVVFACPWIEGASRRLRLQAH